MSSSLAPEPASFCTQTNALLRKNLTFQVLFFFPSFPFVKSWGLGFLLVGERCDILNIILCNFKILKFLSVDMAKFHLFLDEFIGLCFVQFINFVINLISHSEM